MQYPMVSIIVPVYNVERYLPECLDSLLAQTFDDFELICVNDGSTDRSREILGRYAGIDSRVVIIDQTNSGLSAARNAGLEMAQGKYVAFLDSDDFALPDLLEKAVAAAERTDAQVVIYDYYLLQDSTGELGFYRDQELFKRLDGSVFTLQSEPGIAKFIGAWDRLYRRDFIEHSRFRFPVGRLYEDVTFCVETEVAATKMTLLADHLMYYRRGVVGSITNKEGESKKNKEDFLYVQKRAQEAFKSIEAGDEIWRNYAGYFFEYSLMHQSSASSYEVFRWFFESVRDLSTPELLAFAHGGPRVRLYCSLLKIGNPLFAWMTLKALALVLDRPIHALRWRKHRKRLIADGYIDRDGVRLKYPPRPPRPASVDLSDIMLSD